MIRLTIRPDPDGIRHIVAWDGMVVAHSSGAVACAAARALRLMGADDAEMLEFYSPGLYGSLRLRGRLSAFARLTVQENDRVGPRFVRWRPSPFARS